jgi:hypothetical protein
MKGLRKKVLLQVGQSVGRRGVIGRVVRDAHNRSHDRLHGVMPSTSFTRVSRVYYCKQIHNSNK